MNKDLYMDMKQKSLNEPSFVIGGISIVTEKTNQYLEETMNNS